jgi:hypothetical protein
MRPITLLKLILFSLGEFFMLLLFRCKGGLTVVRCRLICGLSLKDTLLLQLETIMLEVCLCCGRLRWGRYLGTKVFLYIGGDSYNCQLFVTSYIEGDEER